MESVDKRFIRFSRVDRSGRTNVNKFSASYIGIERANCASLLSVGVSNFAMQLLCNKNPIISNYTPSFILKAKLPQFYSVQNYIFFFLKWGF